MGLSRIWKEVLYWSGWGLVWTVSEYGEEREDLGRELRREKQGSYTPLG